MYDPPATRIHPAANADNGQWPGDFHAVLAQAEALHDRCERSRDEIRELARQAILLAILLSCFAYLCRNTPLGFEEGNILSRTFGSRPVKAVLAGAATLAVLTYAYSSYEAISGLRRRLAVDRKALRQALGLLRESREDSARAGGWSPLEQGRVGLILERLDAGAGPDR